jgi:molecular chaperone HscB
MSDVVNYFQLFALDVNYTLDTELLETNYRKLQKALHPDRFSFTSNEHHAATIQSAQVNTGYKTLKHEIKRAQHMLEITGCLDLQTDKITDKVFLQQQFSWNMECETAQGQELKQLNVTLTQYYNTLIKDFICAYNEKKIHLAHSIVLKMNFIFKLKCKIN